MDSGQDIHSVEEELPQHKSRLLGKSIYFVWMLRILTTLLALSIVYKLLQVPETSLEYARAENQVKILATAIRTIYHDKSLPAKIDPFELISKSQISSGTLGYDSLARHALGGGIEINSNFIQGGFEIRFEDLSTSACMHLAQARFTPGCFEISIMSDKGDIYSSDIPFDYVSAKLLCHPGHLSNIVWLYH